MTRGLASQKRLMNPPKLFKGIALFTPGGDLVYCIDQDKKSHWHLQLCVMLQELLGLPEPPHFLVPCYTATVDQWQDDRDQNLQIAAEASPLVLRYQPLLNALFGTGNLQWQSTSLQSHICDLKVLASYREQFPDLWQNHELVVNLGGRSPKLPIAQQRSHPTGSNPIEPDPSLSQGFVLRLFVSDDTMKTERILKHLYHLLETSVHQPYTLKVIDVCKNPEQAEHNQVTATPTLMKIWPKPVKRLVGDLTDPSKIQALFIGSNLCS